MSSDGVTAISDGVIKAGDVVTFVCDLGYSADLSMYTITSIYNKNSNGSNGNIGTDINVEGTLTFKTANIPNSSGSSTLTAGTAGQVLTTNGTTVYWGDNPNTDTDTKVTQNYKSTAGAYPILFSDTAGVSSTETRGATTAGLNNKIYVNPSTGSLYTNTMYVDNLYTKTDYEIYVLNIMTHYHDVSGRDHNETENWLINTAGQATFFSVSQTSDETKKEKLGDVTLDLDAIADAPSIYFKWIDDTTDEKHIGSIAQYWLKVLPEVVAGEEGNLSLNYSVLGVISSISLAKEVRELKQTVTELYTENAELKARLAAIEEKLSNI